MQKTMIVICWLLCCHLPMSAQQKGGTYRGSLPEISVQPGITIHFRSPEPIQYVDISTDRIAGDLATANVLRIKYPPDSAGTIQHDLGVLTIAGESFIAQYNLTRADGSAWYTPLSQVEIRPEDMLPLDFPEITMTRREMEAHAMRVLRKNSSGTVRDKRENGIQLSLNGIYTIGQHVFLDITIANRTKLPYDIDAIRFTVDDRKINKATNVQSVEVQPVWQLYRHTAFKRSYRNIYVLRKLTFPGNKVLRINLTEKQLSGRNIDLRIRYGDLLSADSI